MVVGIGSRDLRSGVMHTLAAASSGLRYTGLDTHGLVAKEKGCSITSGPIVRSNMKQSNLGIANPSLAEILTSKMLDNEPQILNLMNKVGGYARSSTITLYKKYK